MHPKERKKKVKGNIANLHPEEETCANILLPDREMRNSRENLTPKRTLNENKGTC